MILDIQQDGKLWFARKK